MNSEQNPRRQRVPRRTAAEVDFLSDRKCCVCKRTDVHIHHLDGDPANNQLENLALLCLTCHHDATITKGLARKLSPETIRRYRKDHYEQVDRRRKAEAVIPTRSQEDEEFEVCVQAVEASEIRKIRAQLAFCDFEEAESLLLRLSDYWLCGDRTKLCILKALLPLAEKARGGLTPKLSWRITNVAANNLPDWNVWIRPARRLSKNEKFMYELAIQIGFAMAYDGALYLKNLMIVKDGADLLWRALRVAWQFRAKDLEERARKEFEGAIDGAERGGVVEIKRLLVCYRDQATQQEIGYPELDFDLEELVYKANPWRPSVG